MKRKSTELDVDFIGGQDPMTKEEEKAISEFIKAHKLLNIKKQIRSTGAIQQRAVEDSEYSPRVKSLLGSISFPKDFDYKKELAESLAKKYLQDDESFH